MTGYCKRPRDPAQLTKLMIDIFSQGSEADAVFYIQKGNIKLTVVSEQGKEAVVGILESR
jgi:CRP-like cAMP-binding protein